MNVIAVSTPDHADWHWRIVNEQGEAVEESHTAFPTIASAVAEGRERLRRSEVRDPILRRPRWGGCR
jgi:hypothetical protein